MAAVHPNRGECNCNFKFLDLSFKFFSMDPKCKICRAFGTKLFLKGERCHNQKCAIIKRNYPPGIRKKRGRMLSEYGLQLREKQKIRHSYGLSERQLKNYFIKARACSTASFRRAYPTNSLGRVSKRLISDVLPELLEKRLDNVIFRLGFAESRSVAKQLVSHGHFYINGRRVTIPSFQIKIGDVVSFKPKSRNKFKDLILKRKEVPSWLALDKEKLEAKITSSPSKESVGEDISKVIEYYSR